jgi:hypothetical protein
VAGVRVAGSAPVDVAHGVFLSGVAGVRVAGSAPVDVAHGVFLSLSSQVNSLGN